MSSKKKLGLPTASPAGVEPRMLTIPQAARYLGARDFFVRNLCRDTRHGKAGLPYLIFGKRIVIDKADLDRFIESQKTQLA